MSIAVDSIEQGDHRLALHDGYFQESASAVPTSTWSFACAFALQFDGEHLMLSVYGKGDAVCVYFLHSSWWWLWD